MTGVVVRVVAVFLAIAPAALILLHIRTRVAAADRSELIGCGLMLGGLMAFTAGMIEVLAMMLVGFEALAASPALMAFAVAAIPEEGLKYLVLVAFLLRHEDCRKSSDVLLAGVSVGVGFAALENIGYVFISSSNGNYLVALARAAGAVPMHACVAMIMAYLLAKARPIADGPRRRALFAAALIVPTLLHGSYDLPLLIGRSKAAVDTEVLLFAALTITLILAATARRCTETLSPSDFGGAAEERRSRLPRHPWFWRIIGALLLGAGILTLVCGFMFWGSTDYARHAYVAFYGVFPALFGEWMLRGPRQARTSRLPELDGTDARQGASRFA